ncbi:reverse transcriptase domain-containing protein, partial [Klebsiella pneumoniae]|uniref:reverse transcriptase domain-containing protein n=1 Tax=Klebsiella pneumoniae TaxID=573 RepID=UPI003EBD6004
LKMYGIRGNIQRWIENWLTERKQRVVINGKESDWMNVTSGVPQGSVLGPVLFLIYIDDIDEGLCCKISKFADDTKIGNRADTPEYRQMIQRDLDKLFNWGQTWQMDFNIDKCKVLNIGSYND